MVLQFVLVAWCCGYNVGSVNGVKQSLGAVSTWMGDCPGNTKPAVDPAVGNGEHTSSVRKYMYVCPGTAHSVSDKRAGGR